MICTKGVFKLPNLKGEVAFLPHFRLHHVFSKHPLYLKVPNKLSFRTGIPAFGDDHLQVT